MIDEAKITTSQSEAAQAWVENFNKGNWEYCVNQYSEEAVMFARPFATCRGRESIQQFWKPFVEGGAGEFVMTNIAQCVVNDQTVLVSADWTMNQVKGVIYNEEWVKQGDKWVIKKDHFHVTHKKDGEEWVSTA